VQRRILAARGGCKESLGQLTEACRTYLLLVANQELEPELQAKGGASDLVQDTFLEAHRDFPRFLGRSEAELRGWLRRILLHNLANWRRHYFETERRKITREISLDDGSATRDLRQALSASRSSPIHEAIQEEQAQALDRALDRLPAHYRAVIVWRHREQSSFEAIGRRLNRTGEAVRKLWTRAVEQLQQELEAHAS
jgi:RNA polymerase sigma-70 factor (ECF subfamily)